MAKTPGLPDSFATATESELRALAEAMEHSDQRSNDLGIDARLIRMVAAGKHHYRAMDNGELLAICRRLRDKGFCYTAAGHWNLAGDDLTPALTPGVLSPEEVERQKHERSDR
jgi:hypothetical protein